MLERVTSKILSKYLGDFVKGLNHDHIHLSLLSGKATFENLEIKEEAIDRLNLPLVLRKGTKTLRSSND